MFPEQSIHWFNYGVYGIFISSVACETWKLWFLKRHWLMGREGLDHGSYIRWLLRTRCAPGYGENGYVALQLDIEQSDS